MTTVLTNKDLKRGFFDEATLLANIERFSMTDLLRTQKLTAFLCVRYVMNEAYAANTEEEYFLCLGNVLRFQPHLSMKDLYDEYVAWEEEKKTTGFVVK